MADRNFQLPCSFVYPLPHGDHTPESQPGHPFAFTRENFPTYAEASSTRDLVLVVFNASQGHGAFL